MFKTRKSRSEPPVVVELPDSPRAGCGCGMHNCCIENDCGCHETPDAAQPDPFDEARDRATWHNTAVRDNTERIKLEAITLGATYRQQCVNPDCRYATHAVPFADRIDQLTADDSE